MARLGELLRKQGHFLLENDTYALIYIAILALIPFAAWLSVAVIALITLRKGWGAGFKGLVVGMLAMLFLSLLSSSWSLAVMNAVMAFLPCYLTAGVLRSTTSWRIAVGFIVLQGLVGLLMIHCLAPEFITEQYQFIQAILKQVEHDNAVADLLNNQDAVNSVVIANYIVGIQAVSIVLSAIASLMLARSIQSGLYYPGGYRQEMINFRASAWGVIVLTIAAIGTYLENPLAISVLPVLAIYYAGAGISISFNILTRGKKGIGTLFLILIPLVLLPFVMLPIYVVLGALDSWFNFRLRLPAKTGGAK
ncbi:hypothetical protein [Legionella hackeliae]|uniref:Transmembrane protein n=1 Tax=Legionella hackeliae TaxID=449 RepID=A0A0A8USX3_LEGHA|nr:hypothetical protein [Legionella hackeliae]KTD13888.1 membrane protein [Legionella hackeliae]CEK10591.1 conserved membrane protein of unknown function [Legionella hackeliae]STX47333.1 membrane protein [Legionella hackeliae]